MAKIPFDIKYRPKIESGEYKVETRDGKPARIICWDKKEYEDQREQPMSIVYLITSKCGCEHIMSCTTDGMYSDGLGRDSDLFIVTPEEELTEWEKVIKDRLWRTLEYSETFRKDENKWVQELATELLALAREQFIKDGYVIEKKAFHDVVEKIDDKHKAEMSVEYSLHCKVENGTRHAIMNWDTFQKVAKKFIDIGKAEVVEKYKQSWFNEGKIAGRFEGLTEDKKYQQGVHDGKEEILKDLPRWKKDESFETEGSFMGVKGREFFVVKDGYSISVSELIEKLPGFKEDSHE